ncbi:hypothetical protein MIND_00003200 [Mycena indigotica]|uniref:Uncharacterized protein n=1 Tax=Mycena indigotica TaxID=2126181 RepID=A0A8H6WDP6_9AGAR|nr:uncharacterized protein MIND_00003200 [Mycena indigotica]KAF7314894.1 hypothetical protein MIND_00003200 [Mycena indigotica]
MQSSESKMMIVTFDNDKPLDREELMIGWQSRLFRFNLRVPPVDPRRTAAQKAGFLDDLDKVIEAGTAWCRYYGVSVSERGILEALEENLSGIELDGGRSVVMARQSTSMDGSEGKAKGADEES